MTEKEKLYMVKVANCLICQLIGCDDPEFTDMVLANVMGGCYIDYDEEAEWYEEDE